MAADNDGSELKKNKKKAEKTLQNGIEDDAEEEPNFSDPEGFVDDITEEGDICSYFPHPVSHSGLL